MNHLSRETSPYLLQHQANPVHWYAWGPEAFAAARAQDKPILLSSGYAACHWCHVMAHESFENPDVAAFMNEQFVNIKLDREERPDVDRLYMAALHAMGEQGGWPLNVFLTPEAEPFWGGTYFPPEPRYGRPSFLQVLHAISRLWTVDRDKALNAGRNITAHFKDQAAAQKPATDIPSPAQITQLAKTITDACDMIHGGLKGAPKFPQAPLFQFLWQQHLTTDQTRFGPAVASTLTNISNGGIYDHLAGGIARYATDARWLIPHFEKMLYDNAQFVSLASRAHLAQSSELFSKRVHDTIGFMLSDMMTEANLFTSSYDADSEGEEGKYYTWTREEVEAALPPDLSTPFTKHYDITPAGNFEGKNILNRLGSPAVLDASTEQQLSKAKNILLALRRQRVPPLHDDKILADWNGLAITTLAEAALVFGNPEWLTTASKSFAANITTFWKDGLLWHSHRLGQTKHRATAHDYAHLIEAALSLASIGADEKTLRTAVVLTKAFEQQHWEEAAHGFLLTARDANDLPANAIPVIDDVTPSPNALMAKNYITLSYLTDELSYFDKARDIISHQVGTALQNPFAAPAMLTAAAIINAPLQLTLYGGTPITSPLLRAALQKTGLNATIICKPGDTGEHSMTVCKGTHCSLPAINEKGVQDALSFIGL